MTTLENKDYPDYYNILGINKGASASEIKKAYRKLAMQWHPDKNSSQLELAQEKFQKIAEAYDVLSDKEKRGIFDQFGYEGLRDGAPDGAGNTKGSYHFEPNAQEIFENFFSVSNPFAEFGFGDTVPFGSKLRKPGPKKADPILQDLPCTLEEIFNGCTKKLNVTRKRYTPEGDLQDDTKMLTINVKPGWKKGTKITFPNEGDEAPDIVPADIVFVLTEKEHPTLIREGANLVQVTTIPLVDALTDCFVEVKTLDGRQLSLPCPEVVAPGYNKVIAGEGMPISKKPGSRGDLIIRFQIKFPTYISDTKKVKLREILAQPAQKLRLPPKPKVVVKKEEE